MIKYSQQTRNRRQLPQLPQKTTANISLNGEKLDDLLLRLGIKQGCVLLSLLLITILEGLANAIREENKIIGKPLGRKKVLFVHR